MIGLEARYSCNSSYSLQGDDTRICSSSEEWSGSEPICVTRNQTEPAGTDQGTVIGSVVAVSVVLITIVSAHRRILGMASVVCVLVKICVSSISLYKLDTDKLTAPFESAH